MMLDIYYSFFVLSWFVIVPREVTIKFQQGKIRGTITTTKRGKEYYAFRGIYYAESPEGPRRFKPPISKRRLTDTDELDATNDGPSCWQRDILTNVISGYENCLVLNVNTPGNANSNVKHKYPVMVWIHGGGWQHGHGSSWLYGPGKFMDKDIVFVSINYRLGPFGFLCTNDSAAGGNYGMLDQVEALKWIRDNIEDFGGDPGQVTLFGQSAGAVSAIYHMLSPLSKGLFHRCIAMSGNPVSPWVTGDSPVYWTQKLAAYFNCPINTSNEELVKCLRNIDPYQLIESYDKLSEYYQIRFYPTVDGSFLESSPQEMIAQGRIYNKVPVIIGGTKDEGAGLFALLYRKLMEYSDKFVEKTVKMLYSTTRNSTTVENLIKEKYFNSNVDLKDKLQVTKAASKFISDSMEISNYITVDYLTAADVKTYLYSFDFEGLISIAYLMGIFQHIGVGHGDDLFQLFELAGQSFSDVEISNGLISMFTNFVIFGDPNRQMTTKWPRASTSQIPVFHIDIPTSITFVNRTDWRFNFWVKEVPEAFTKDEL